MIGIPIALAYTNLSEWVIHKHILHGLGRKKTSFWSFHWHEHHRNTRSNDHIDPAYERSLFGWHAQSKEALALLAAGISVAPLFPIAPFFVGTVWYSLVHYHAVHKKAHQDPGWAREHLPWHYDHHMGPDQDANWCVTRPWADILLGTRKPYAGTEAEAKDLARLEAKKQAKREAAAAVAA